MLSTTSLKHLLVACQLFTLAICGVNSAPLASATLGSSTHTSGTVQVSNDGMSVAIEYYHSGLDHYFITAEPREIEALASGKFSGWIPTGERFAVLPPDSPIDSSTPVCRFYGNPAKGLNSHFYSGIPGECAEVQSRFADSWLLESSDVYRAFLPDIAGSCPSGTEAVYRLWNNRADVNHRYTTSTEIAERMKALGYIAEGFGAALTIPVALCAPVGVACALAASNPTPSVGSGVTLTSTCTGSPTHYVWSGCNSDRETCLASSANTGIQTYGVVATGPDGVSAPAAIAVDWQAAQLTGTAPGATATNGPSLPGSTVSCSVTASNTAPTAGSSITLSTLCTVLPTSFAWTGCASNASTCTATSSTGGSVTYSVKATTSSGVSSPATVTVNWQGTQAPGPTIIPTVSTPTPVVTPAPTPIAAIPAGEARVISRNTLADVWQGPQPAGGGTIYKGLQWCSAIYAPMLGSNGSIVFSGGGDADSWDTAAFAFDIAVGKWTRIKDRTNALSWNPAADSARPVGDPLRWDAVYAEHGDGTPGAPHTYDLLTYLPPEAGGGPKGSMLYPGTHFAYLYGGTMWAHKLALDQPSWSRASTGPAMANSQLLGMADYDPTSKRVWIVPATTTGAYVSAIAYFDFTNGIGVPGSVALDKDYLVSSGTMRFWRGVDGTKRYLVMLSYNSPESRLNIIDLDAPLTGVHPVKLSQTPTNFGYPGSGFALGTKRGFAMHPTPDQDGSKIYEITPPADALHGIWTITPKPLNGIALPAVQNIGLWKRLEYIESLDVVTFFVSADGPVYAYRPTLDPSTVPAQTTTTATPAPNPTPAPTPTPTPTPTLTPVASTGTLKLSTVAVPYTGPSGVLGSSKHLNFARFGNRWYKMTGDHHRIDSDTADFEDGRQEIISFNVVANDWHEDQPFFLRSGMNLGDVQMALPDDAFSVERNGEIWVFVTARVDTETTAARTASVQSQYGGDIVTQDMQHFGAWNPTTRSWRAIGTNPPEMAGGNTWRGMYDALTDRIIIPTPSSFLQIRGSDGADISPRFGTPAVQLMEYGNFDFHVAGMVQDGRIAYVYDKKFGALYSVQLDANPFVVTKVLDLPDLTYNAGSGPGITIVWHPDLRAVIIGGTTQKLYAFEVDTGKLTTWDRTDGFIAGDGAYVYPATMFYDPDTKDVVSVGGIDWNTGMASPNYWRLHLTK